jgi:hypothetical protein
MASSAAQESSAMLIDLIAKVKSIPNGKGSGVFYWEPECYSWCNYSMGAWNTNGRPTIALDGFLSSISSRRANSDFALDSKTGQLRVSVNQKALTISLRYWLINKGAVSINIVDILGKEELSIINQTMPQGMHSTTLRSGNLPPGAYFCSIKSDGKTSTLMFPLF